MAKYPCILSLAVKLVPAIEPDGAECAICEDTIYLEAMKAIFVTPDTGKKVGGLDFRFCQSCGNAMSTAIEEGG